MPTKISVTWKCLVQVWLRTEVLCTQRSPRLGFKFMTSRSWQDISCQWVKQVVGSSNGRALSPILFQLVIYEFSNLFTIPLQRIECVLYGLVDGFLDVFAHFLDLVHTTGRLVGVGDVDGRHVEASAIQPRTLAQLLGHKKDSVLRFNECYMSDSMMVCKGRGRL